MLYGNVEQREFILNQAQDYANSLDVNLVFGAMLGSVAAGIHYLDSDYDARFLYLRKDFPAFTCDPSEMTEDKLVKRFYLKDNVVEKIPLWEMTSFLRLLICPSFLNNFSIGLYNTADITFMSPYVWDPYGLQNKIIPFINQFFRADYKIAFQKDAIHAHKKYLSCGRGAVKPCLQAVHAAATIEWCLTYKEHPPVDLQTLLQGLERDGIWRDSKALLDEVRQTVRSGWADGVSDLKSLHLSACVDYSSTLLEYVDEMVKKAEVADRFEETNIDHADAIIRRIYCVIERSVFESEPLRYRGKGERSLMT